MRLQRFAHPLLHHFERAGQVEGSLFFKQCERLGLLNLSGEAPGHILILPVITTIVKTFIVNS